MLKSELRFKYCLINLRRMCEEVYKTVLEKISQQIETDEEEYCLILIKLIVEGALRMFEPELSIRCLPQHTELVEKVLEAS